MRELFLLLLAFSSILPQQSTFTYYFQSPNQTLIVNVTSVPSDYAKPYNLSNGILLVLNSTPQNISSNVSFDRINSTAVIIPLYALEPNSIYQINFTLPKLTVVVYLSSTLRNDRYHPVSSGNYSSSNTNLRNLPFIVFIVVMVIISILLNRRKRH